ncbi:MAG: helix-turn-helix domain-containing protein [Campylobacterota bacterium]|nr:helix-turn-helix domain-containing protein [Campylobacterota bacterium]
MSQSTRLTVQEYAQNIGKSKQSVYNRIKRGTLPTTTIDKQVYIEVDEIDNLVNQSVNQPMNNPIESIESPVELKEIKSFKKENKKLKKIIDSKDIEIRDLLERIITLEKQQKNEIIKQQDLKHQELKMYMEFIQKQSENLLPPQTTATKEDKHINNYDDIIDADIEKKKKKKNKSKK